MSRNDVERYLLKDKPHLTDQPIELIPACSDMRIFHGLRRMVQKFGAHTYLAQIAKIGIYPRVSVLLVADFPGHWALDQTHSQVFVVLHEETTKDTMGLRI
jgi:hypothetical protein